ncbi:MAG: hypothetical protein Ta2A_01400 [Treponemataceae bacterium]|nr:MAG: hypothetical protein Ta2A_01400 [Treponemataceae bacterium]
MSLCFDGETVDTEYPGWRSNWQEYRYAIYEKQGNIDGQKELAAQFTLQGDFDYFLKLKALYQSDKGQSADWQSVLDDLLQTMESGKRYFNNYIEILIHEHLQERILKHCKKASAAIKRLYPHLLPEYLDDVDALLLQCIREDAKRASSREMYRSVCEIIRDYKKACGKTRAGSIIAELQEQHPRQPAFLDELRKIG